MRNNTLFEKMLHPYPKKRLRKPGKMLQKRYNSNNKTGKPDSYHEQPHVMPSVWLFLFRINLLND